MGNPWEMGMHYLCAEYGLSTEGANENMQGYVIIHMLDNSIHMLDNSISAKE